MNSKKPSFGNEKPRGKMLLQLLRRRWLVSKRSTASLTNGSVSASQRVLL